VRRRPSSVSSTVVSIGATLAILWGLTQTPLGLEQMLWSTAAWWLAATLWLWWGPRRGGSRHALPRRLRRAGAGCRGARAHLVLIEPRGRELLLFLVVLGRCLPTLGAYFGGRRFGAPQARAYVSPGKTWEGSQRLGAAAVVAIGGGVAVCDAVGELARALSRGAAVSVIGDLVESMVQSATPVSRTVATCCPATVACSIASTA
jgi:CDP-diglyceride synthetase